MFIFADLFKVALRWHSKKDMTGLESHQGIVAEAITEVVAHLILGRKFCKTLDLAVGAAGPRIRIIRINKDFLVYKDKMRP